MSLTKEQVTILSPEQRNVMIAELCGWINTSSKWEDHCLGRNALSPSGIPPHLIGKWEHADCKENSLNQKGGYPFGWYYTIPNYCGSLDAMATAIASLNPAQQLAWLSILQQIVEPNYGLGCVLATAEQRAITFLMVMGKESV